MSYVVKSSERTRKSGADCETKALLHLMTLHPDSDSIYYFIVDFFNDVTGMDNMGGKLWDVQSKGAQNVSPKAIGKELITLFKNYTSSFQFETFMLFIQSVSSSVRIDSTLNVFDVENIQPSALSLLKEGLIEEGENKEYINNDTLTDANISDFLNKIIFVINENKQPSEYIKGIIKNHPNITPPDDVLTAIFNEIRNAQSNKKNTISVENLTIESPETALNYGRHLTSNEIRLLTLQRIINGDPLNKGVPTSFIPIYTSCPPEQQKDLLENCQQSLCRALFNKNAADHFWKLFENTYTLILNNPTDGISELFLKLREIPDCTSNCSDFDVLSLKFFIAIIKDGVS